MEYLADTFQRKKDMAGGSVFLIVREKVCLTDSDGFMTLRSLSKGVTPLYSDECCMEARLCRLVKPIVDIRVTAQALTDWNRFVKRCFSVLQKAVNGL